MRKKLHGPVAILAMVLAFLCATMPVFAMTYITDPAALNGSDYTKYATLAETLQAVFKGDIDIFSNSSCTKEVSMPVGMNVSKSTQYYVKSKTSGNTVSGWQCYIYANAVYNKLFNEWVGHADSGFSHSEIVLSGGSSTVSYTKFKNAGVRCGAYLRTTTNSSGAYSGSGGHSMIILAYDADSVTYLEGNGDGNGLIRVAVKSWSEFNASQLSGKGRYLSHVVQPKASYYDSLYSNRLFADVSEESWYYETVAEAYQLGLMQGATATLFKPEVPMTRGMLAVVLHRMEGSPKVTFTQKFPDVLSDRYYATAVLWAAGKGVVNGYSNGLFRPERNVTREEVATMLCNYAKFLGKYKKATSTKLNQFKDYNKISSYAKESVQWAVANGLLSGKDNGTRLDPQGTATRAECTKMLLQAYKVLKQ